MIREIDGNDAEMTSVFVDDAGHHFLETLVSEGGLYSLYAELYDEQVKQFFENQGSAIILARQFASPGITSGRASCQATSGLGWDRSNTSHDPYWSACSVFRDGTEGSLRAACREPSWIPYPSAASQAAAS